MASKQWIESRAVGLLSQCSLATLPATLPTPSLLVSHFQPLTPLPASCFLFPYLSDQRACQGFLSLTL